MLILSRRIDGPGIIIDGPARIIIFSNNRPGRGQIGIEAPPTTIVLREELVPVREVTP
jgi:sRNA-binding carbon storage regulator CsrA